MIALDASVLIAHFEPTDAHHDRATQLLWDASDEALGASPITVAEILVGPTRDDRLEAAQSALRDLGVSEIPLAEDASVRLADLRVSSGLRLPDCCVLLASQSSGGQLATFDERLASAAVELGLEVRRWR